ncbi:MAG: hypothetical protein HY722_10395 [Planctomycetes bacterium]|nr:hypothetical protein [Planctomycetota bacterium]
MRRRLGGWALVAGAALGVLAPALAAAVDAAWGREVLPIAPHHTDVVALNRATWQLGEPVAEVYGLPARAPIRVIRPDPARLVVPEEDRTLVLLAVDRQAGENPLQARTLGVAARYAMLAGAALSAAGAAVRWLGRPRSVS